MHYTAYITLHTYSSKLVITDTHTDTHTENKNKDKMKENGIVVRKEAGSRLTTLINWMC